MVANNTKTLPELGPMTKDFPFGEGFEFKRIDEDKRTFTGLANASTIDRVGDRIDSAGMDLTQFRKQPVLLINHQPFLPSGAPGRIGDVTQIEATEKGLPITAKVYDDYELADFYWPFISKRRLAGLSIGFRPDAYEWRDEMSKGETITYRQITKAELLEVSVVMIQANRESMIKRYAGSASEGRNTDGGCELRDIRELIQRLTADQRFIAERLDDLDEATVAIHNLTAGINPEDPGLLDIQEKSEPSGDELAAGLKMFKEMRNRLKAG